MYDMNMTAEKAIAVLNNHRLNECDNQKLIRAEVEAIQALEEIQSYRAIGTVEEFKALKEQAEPKKIVYCKQSYGTPYFCPECMSDQIKVEFMRDDGYEPKEKHSYCWKCGQKLDWGNE